ncbi:MAG: lysozyme [Bacteroidales bacterium]
MKNELRLSDNGKNVIKGGLKLYLNAYINESKSPAIGYGITRYPDGVIETHSGNVRIGDRISKHDADALFDYQMMLFEECVNNFVRVPLSQNQFDALVHFCYFNGIENFLLHPSLTLINKFEYRKAMEGLKANPKNSAERSVASPKETNIMESIYNLFLS